MEYRPFITRVIPLYMRTIFLFFPLLLASELLWSQSTRPDTLSAAQRHYEIGLNITNTLGSFVGSANSLTTDPYLLSFRVGSATRRLRMGLNFRIRDKSDPNFSGFLKEKETVVNLRTGYERVSAMSRHLAMYWGLDGVFEHSKNRVTSSSSSGSAALDNRQWRAGIGPVLGIAWRPHPRVAFTTECSVYALYRRGTERVSAPPDFSTKNIREFVWQPALPTSLFVNFAF